MSEGINNSWAMDFTMSPHGDLNYTDSAYDDPSMDLDPPPGYQIRTPSRPGLHIPATPATPVSPDTPKSQRSINGESTPTIISKNALDLEQTESVEKSTEKLNYDEDENKERGNWSGKLDFLLSCLGYAVGLGNVWRFPYLCYRNGGGAFFIPYFLMLTFVGLPLFFLELSLGQFTSNGPLTCWDFAPIFRGIGMAMWIVSFLVSIYYNMIIAWSLYYLCASFTSALPWRNCDDGWWNTDHCNTRLIVVNCTNVTEVKYPNGTCWNATSQVGLWNETIYQNETGLRRISPAEEYYNNRVLRINEGIEDGWGEAFWDLTLCLLAIWIVVFLCLIKGVKSSGKVVWFTALFPYVVLLVLFFRGVTLTGAGQGIYFYVVPRFHLLLDARVWKDAAVQIFFSLSTGWGGLITLASYNRFHNNTLRDSILVALGNCGTSIFAGFVIFSFLGYMAHVQKTSVENVVSSGPGLAFIVYPSAVTLMPVSPLWAILFFMMLLTLGLDSQFASVESIVTSLLDRWPKILRPKKIFVIAIACAMMFLLGIPLCTRAGPFILQLMDSYAGGWTLLLIGVTESLAISVLYGCDRFFTDIEIMNGKRPNLWWKICWMVMTPILVTGILLFTWADYKPTKYGSDYFYPAWADVIGWMMSVIASICIPGYAIFFLCREEGSLMERLKNGVTPTIFWGPALVKHRQLISPYVKGFYEDPWNRQMVAPMQGVDNPAASTFTLSETTPSIMSLAVRGLDKSSGTLISSASGAGSMKSYESTV